MQEICQVISWGMSQVQGADAPATQGVSDPGEAKHEPSTSHLSPPSFPQALLCPMPSFTLPSCRFFPRTAFVFAFSHVQGNVGPSLGPTLSPCRGGSAVLIPTLDLEREHGPVQPNVCSKWQKGFKCRKREFKITGSLILYSKP